MQTSMSVGKLSLHISRIASGAPNRRIAIELREAKGGIVIRHL
jgi:5-hydroxyisourate hydrolase-like protein (transthyretin family)